MIILMVLREKKSNFFLIFLLFFLVFGTFDALKIYPANISERLYGGWGIVIDDIIAGAYTALTVFFLLKFIYI